MYSAQTEHMAEVPFKRYTTVLPVTERVRTVSSELFARLRSGAEAPLIHESSWGKVKSHNKIAGYARL